MLRKTVLSLKSPTGAFIAPLRCANANLFNKVQEKLAKNKKAPARHKAEESYLLTTKLYCGKCGALMFGESGVSHTGKMYTYYKCAAAKKKKTCDQPDGFKDLLTGDFCCRRLFVLPGLRFCRGQVLGVEVRFDSPHQLAILIS